MIQRKFYIGMIVFTFSVFFILALIIIAMVRPITQAHWGVWWICFIGSWIGFLLGSKELDDVTDYIREKEAIDSIELVELDRPPEAEKREDCGDCYRPVSDPETPAPGRKGSCIDYSEFLPLYDLYADGKSLGPVDDAVRNFSRKSPGTK